MPGKSIMDKSLTMNDLEALGEQIRQDAHRLKNLILIIQGNLELLLYEPGEEDGSIDDITKSFKECREITQRLLAAGSMLSNAGMKM